MGSCPFCEETPMKDREFYRVGGWYAVLDHRPMADGHVLLVARKSGAEYPVELNQKTLSGLDSAIAEIVPLLRKHFGVANVLIASLRDKLPHVHWHLVPVHEDLLTEWREAHGIKEGHMFSFLGWLGQKKPKAPFPDSELERDVRALRELARYDLA